MRPRARASFASRLTDFGPVARSYVEVLDRYFGNVCELDLCGCSLPRLLPLADKLTTPLVRA